MRSWFRGRFAGGSEDDAYAGVDPSGYWWMVGDEASDRGDHGQAFEAWRHSAYLNATGPREDRR